jgi:hypothetical protein
VGTSYIQAFLEKGNPDPSGETRGCTTEMATDPTNFWKILQLVLSNISEAYLSTRITSRESKEGCSFSSTSREQN